MEGSERRRDSGSQPRWRHWVMTRAAQSRESHMSLSYSHRLQQQQSTRPPPPPVPRLDDALGLRSFIPITHPDYPRLPLTAPPPAPSRRGSLPFGVGSHPSMPTVQSPSPPMNCDRHLSMATGPVRALDSHDPIRDPTPIQHSIWTPSKCL